MSEALEPVNKSPRLYQNYVSFLGGVLVLACLASILLLLLIETTGRRSTPYIGIFAWVILPAIMVFGLGVIVFGMVLERRRRRSQSTSKFAAYPVIDLNDPQRRRFFLVFLAFTFVFVSISVFGSYRA